MKMNKKLKENALNCEARKTKWHGLCAAQE